MDKITKNIINKTIERAYFNLDGEFPELLNKNPKLAREHQELSDKADELSAKLEKLLPEQYKNLVEDLVSATLCTMSIESQVLFKEGAIKGCTDLSYLGEAGLILNFI
jgi:FtsZ-binding cell division protein ZapB